MKRQLRLLFALIYAAALWAQSPEEIVNIRLFSDRDKLVPGESFALALEISVARSWHINSHQPLDEFVIPTEIAIEKGEGAEWGEWQYPEAQIVELESLGGKTSTFQGQSIARISGVLADSFSQNELNVTAVIHYQGCNDQVCMAPVEKSVSITLPVAVSGEAALMINSEYFLQESSQQNTSSLESYNESNDFAKKAGERSFILTLLIVFLGGLALNLTPCVYPLIPITVSYFGGQGGKKGSAALEASMYVLGMSVTYSVLGTFAAMTGEMFGTALTNPVVLIFIATVMLILSLSMFGVYEFRLPTFLMQVGGGARSGAVGALIMGLTMGIVAAPCIGPFVIGLLTYVAQQGSAFIGFIMFFTLSMGLGLPYLFLGIFSSRISTLPKSGEWLNGVRIFFGLVLVGMALYFINPLLPAAWRAVILPGYLILAGVYYAVFDKSGSKAAWFIRLKMIIALVAVAAGTWLIKPAPASVSELIWQSWSQEALLLADETDRNVVIDVYADWCIPCKELEHLTFSDPKVQSALKNFTLLKVNLTQDKSELAQMLITKYGIKGVPTIIFLDGDGHEIMAARLTGFENAVSFLKRVNSLQ